MKNNYIKMVADIISQHRGKKNAVSSGSIAKEVGINDDGTHSIVRSIISTLISDYAMPIGSCKNGYYIISNDVEYNECVSDLMNRSNAIRCRADMIENNYRKVRR